MGNCSSKKQARHVEEARQSDDVDYKVDAVAKQANPPETGGKRLVFVLGGPGCGKGTQCARLHDRFGFAHLSAGDLLRDEVASGSPLAEQLKETFREGRLAPDDIIIRLLRRAIHGSDSDVVLVDGFPRSAEQAAAAEDALGPPLAVLHFECSEATMKERVLGRGKSSGRSDDNEEALAKRLVTFRRQTTPVRELYERRAILRVVDAEQVPDAVFSDVCVIVEALEAAEAGSINRTAASAAAAASAANKSAQANRSEASSAPAVAGATAAASTDAAGTATPLVEPAAGAAPAANLSSGGSSTPVTGSDELPPVAEALPPGSGAATEADEEERAVAAPAAGTAVSPAAAAAAADGGGGAGVALRRTSSSSPRARRTGPRASGGSRSVSPTKRRNTGKAPPVAHAKSAPVIAAAAVATDSAAAAESEPRVPEEDDAEAARLRDQAAAEKAAQAEEAALAPAPGDDPIIAEAKRVAAQTLQGGRRTSGHARSGSPRSTRTRTGSVAAAGDAKPFGWIYGSADAGPAK